MDILNRPPGVLYARKEEHIQDKSCKYDHTYDQQQLQHQQHVTLTDKTLPKPKESEIKSSSAAIVQSTEEEKQQHSTLADNTVSKQTDPLTTSASAQSIKYSHTSDGLSLNVCGKGELVILFPESNGSGEKGQENVGKISLSVETTTLVVLRAPTIKGFDGVDFQCRGSIDIHLDDHGNDKVIHAKESRSNADPTAVDNEDNRPGFTKSHRRDKSDFILVSGESTSAKELVLDENKSNTKIAKKVPCVNASNECYEKTGCCSGKRVNLNRSIRDNFTHLLQEISLMPLCDHLYQNQVIDMETYQSLYEGKKNVMTTQDGIRKLLMTLSTMTVKKVPVLKALLESDHKDIIPMLLPKYLD